MKNALWWVVVLIVFPSNVAALVLGKAPSLRERVAIADVVVVGRVTGEIKEGPTHWQARFAVKKVLKGRAGKQILVGYDYQSVHERRIVDSGTEYVLFLSRCGAKRYRPVNAQGILKGGKVAISSIEKLVKTTRAQWRENPNGIRVLLYSKQDVYRSNEKIDLTLWIQNGTGKPISVNQLLSTLSRDRVRLLVKVKYNGVDLASRKLRVPDQYHELKVNQKQFTLGPGRSVSRTISGINLPSRTFPIEKKDLGFQYFPMHRTGRYRVVVKLKSLTPGNEVTKSHALMLRVK